MDGRTHLVTTSLLKLIIATKNTTTVCNLFGCYLDVKSIADQDKVSRVWHKLRGKIDTAIDRGEGAILIGDLNRPLQLGIPSSFGTKLLELWLEGESVTLLNDRQICTRFDPVTGKGSLLDVGITSNNIRKAVTNIEVDTENKWTPSSMTKILRKPS